jgi:hypothetical protein
MNSCVELINLDATCDAVKKVGGVTARVWFGVKSDWFKWAIGGGGPELSYNQFPPPYTDMWGISYDANTITQTELYYFEGVQLKNSASFEVVPAENVNAFTHRLDLVLFGLDEVQHRQIEQLLLEEDLFAIVATEAGAIKIYGFENKLYDPQATGTDDIYVTDKRGLKTISGTGVETVELQGEQGVLIQLEAQNLLSGPIILNAIYEVNGTDYVDTFVDMINELNLLAANN